MNKLGIYLIVDFDWPTPFKPEYGQLARELHDAAQDLDWFKEVMAGSGGLGGGQSSVWVFWLENYAALDRLFSDQDELASAAYRAFFSVMVNVEDRVREQVHFL